MKYVEFNDTRWHFRPPSATLNTTEDKPEEPPVPRPRPHCVAPPRTTDSEIRSKALPRAACSLSLSDHNPNVAGRSKPGHCRVPAFFHLIQVRRGISLAHVEYYGVHASVATAGGLEGKYQKPL